MVLKKIPAKEGNYETKSSRTGNGRKTIDITRSGQGTRGGAEDDGGGMIRCSRVKYFRRRRGRDLQETETLRKCLRGL